MSSGPSLLLLLLLLVVAVGAAQAGLHMQHCKRSLRQTWFESCGGLSNPSQFLDGDRRKRHLDTRPDVRPSLLQGNRGYPRFRITDDEMKKFNHVFERMTRSPDTFSDCCRNLDRCLKEKPFPCV